MPADNFLCGIIMTAKFDFIGNSDIGDNGNLIEGREHLKVTCPKCIKVFKENGL